MRILWIPHAGWHIPQRAHLFCKRLALRHDVHVTDWVADFHGLSDYLSKRHFQNYLYRQYRDGDITVHHVPRISPALPFRLLRRLNQSMFSSLVQEIIQKHQIEAVVGTFVVPPPQGPYLVFDLFDENVSAWRKRFPTYAAEIDAVERKYIAQANVVVTASSVLTDKVQGINPGCHTVKIPNGVDFSLFRDVNSEAIRQHLNITGKLVGSVGNHDSMPELAKILDAAQLLQDQPITFLIAGRGAAVSAAKKMAVGRRLQNIRFWGSLSQQEAADVISALDVGLCPYQKSEMDDARSPMRLLMYLAAGIPVVCTEVEEVRRMAMPVVLVEDSARALGQGIQQALTMPKGRSPQINEFDIDLLVDRYEAVILGNL